MQARNGPESDGGATGGLYWQIVPKGFQEMMQSPNRAGAKRAAEAMLKMVKLDIAELERAFKG